MDTDKATAIREARQQLRAAGKLDSMNAVVSLLHCSKRTARKYWPETDPVDAAAPPGPVPPPGQAVTEEAFRASFRAYVEAGMRWLATQGLMGNGDVFECTKVHRWAKRRPTVYAISRWHPLVEELEDELEAAYEAHLALWEQVQAAERPAPAPEPTPAPEPEPEPAPFDLVNLRAYYFDRRRSPWPAGVTPPIESYGLLRTLWQEIDQEQAAAQRQRYVVMNAQGADAPAMAAVEDRQSAASVMLHHIKSDMNILEMRAHDQGVPLPT